MDIISVVRHLQLTVILKDKEDPTIDRNSLNIISVVGAFYTVIFKGIKEHKRERNPMNVYSVLLVIFKSFK